MSAVIRHSLEAEPDDSMMVTIHVPPEYTPMTSRLFMTFAQRSNDDTAMAGDFDADSKPDDEGDMILTNLLNFASFMSSTNAWYEFACPHLIALAFEAREKTVLDIVRFVMRDCRVTFKYFQAFLKKEIGHKSHMKACAEVYGRDFPIVFADLCSTVAAAHDWHRRDVAMKLGFLNQLITYETHMYATEAMPSRAAAKRLVDDFGYSMMYAEPSHSECNGVNGYSTMLETALQCRNQRAMVHIVDAICDIGYRWTPTLAWGVYLHKHVPKTPETVNKLVRSNRSFIGELLNWGTAVVQDSEDSADADVYNDSHDDEQRVSTSEWHRCVKRMADFVLLPRHALLVKALQCKCHSLVPELASELAGGRVQSTEFVGLYSSSSHYTRTVLVDGPMVRDLVAVIRARVFGADIVLPIVLRQNVNAHTVMDNQMTNQEPRILDAFIESYGAGDILACLPVVFGDVGANSAIDRVRKQHAAELLRRLLDDAVVARSEPVLKWAALAGIVHADYELLSRASAALKDPERAATHVSNVRETKRMRREFYGGG